MSVMCLMDTETSHQREIVDAKTGARLVSCTIWSVAPNAPINNLDPFVAGLDMVMLMSSGGP